MAVGISSFENFDDLSHIYLYEFFFMSLSEKGSIIQLRLNPWLKKKESLSTKVRKSNYL